MTTIMFVFILPVNKEIVNIVIKVLSVACDNFSTTNSKVPPPKGPTRVWWAAQGGAQKVRTDPYEGAKHRQRAHPRKKDVRPDTKDRRCGRCGERQKGTSRDSWLFIISTNPYMLDPDFRQEFLTKIFHPKMGILTKSNKCFGKIKFSRLPKSTNVDSRLKPTLFLKNILLLTSPPYHQFMAVLTAPPPFHHILEKSGRDRYM